MIFFLQDTASTRPFLPVMTPFSSHLGYDTGINSIYGRDIDFVEAYCKILKGSLGASLIIREVGSLSYERLIDQIQLFGNLFVRRI